MVLQNVMDFSSKISYDLDFRLSNLLFTYKNFTVLVTTLCKLDISLYNMHRGLKTASKLLAVCSRHFPDKPFNLGIQLSFRNV